ncbi:helix-turn-helix domain-containing protein [Laspinema sp. A4]|uniref:helix-turn-helix domain-containing protein n=1 Tax=Laspinema sp. D2d TaxID=2953686 RepID=UPI0021BB6B11|nr:helix-turn-helix domain-containing protein [Laspinema sp. D2d]MCT7986648.1 helix-turn-helix domain-containing protein [Laspinema sp. D2d]
MPRRITIQPHLSVAELESRYRKSKDPVERTHYQIIWLLAKGLSTEQVAEVTGYCRDWIRQVAHRYNKEGSAGLGDRRHENPGAERLLSPQQETQLWEALQGPAPHGGLWNSRTVADWISERIARPVAVQRGWDYLQQMKARLAAEGTLNG